VWDKNPQARRQKVRNDGTVNNDPNTAGRLASEAGTGSVASGSIRGNPVSSGVFIRAELCRETARWRLAV
jgi:hypothetical protein